MSSSQHWSRRWRGQVAAVVIALALKPLLLDLGRRIRNVKYAGLEAELDALERLSTSAERDGIPAATSVDPAVLALIGQAPDAAVEQAWRRMRDQIHAAAYAVSAERLNQTEALEPVERPHSFVS